MAGLNAGGTPVRVGVVGKYTSLRDAYLSVLEALRHAAGHAGVRLEAELIDADNVEVDPAGELAGFDAVVICGGFGDRGVPGKVAAARSTREQDIPCLGICLGMQTQVLDVARNLCGLHNANSQEFDPDCEHPVVHYMGGLHTHTNRNGSMRLGAHAAVLTPGSRVAQLYGGLLAVERHRYRLEVNLGYRDELESVGLRFAGMSPDGSLVEFIELDDHPFWVGTKTGWVELMSPHLGSLNSQRSSRSVRREGWHTAQGHGCTWCET